MKTNSIKRINITLPVKTLDEINRIAKRGNRSHFIDRAVKFYVQEVGVKNLRATLKEGAIKRSERDSNISASWFKLDEEVWRESEQ